MVVAPLFLSFHSRSRPNDSNVEMKWNCWNSKCAIVDAVILSPKEKQNKNAVPNAMSLCENKERERVKTHLKWLKCYMNVNWTWDNSSTLIEFGNSEFRSHFSTASHNHMVASFKIRIWIIKTVQHLIRSLGYWKYWKWFSDLPFDSS